jgi:hypothetical protein
MLNRTFFPQFEVRKKPVKITCTPVNAAEEILLGFCGMTRPMRTKSTAKE